MDIKVSKYFFKYNKYKISFYELTSSNSTKPFVFINGFFDPIENHLDLLKILSQKGFKVFAINMPGHGESDKVPNVDWDLLVDIIKVFKDYKSFSKFIIGGFSLGAGAALIYTSKFSSEVQEVILLSPFCYNLPSKLKMALKVIYFQSKLIFKSIFYKNNKSKTSNKVFPVYYLKNYKNLIHSFKLENEILPKVSITIGKHDELIDLNLIKSSLKNLKIKYKVIENLGHDIYYQNEEMIESIVENLLK